MGKAKGTLVILTFNEIEGLREIFPLIPLDKIEEVFVIDGGSKDGTLEFFKKNKRKKVKTITVNLTQDEIDLLEAEKAFFADPKNKRKKWDYKDPEIHKRYKGGLMVKPKAAKRGY